MFEDSLLDSGGALRKRKTWPKLVSFVIEVGAISVLVLAPLIYTQGLPKQQIVDILRLPPPTVVKPATPQKLRVSSGVAAGMLMYQLKPTYPRLAAQARIHGTVVAQVVIAKDGTVHDLHVIGGHPMLVPAAIEAVRQRRYRPYLLNHEPREVDTQINVNFTLSGG